MAIATAFDKAFDTFVNGLYTRGVIPTVAVLDDNVDEAAYFKNTGRIAVLKQDEADVCAVFGNWGTYYAFEGWLAYRAIQSNGQEFQLMVADVLSEHKWSPETVKWIGIIDGLVNVQEEYADKFGHYPADIHKFIKSCVRYGAETVLSADRY